MTADRAREMPYAAIPETSTEGARWYIWKAGHGINYVGGKIASEKDAKAIAAELNALALQSADEVRADGWRPIETAERPDDDAPLVMLLQDGRRFIGQWDSCAGHWQGIFAFDGTERVKYFQEWPGRLYSPESWRPLPPAPEMGR